MISQLPIMSLLREDIQHHRVDVVDVVDVGPSTQHGPGAACERLFVFSVRACVCIHHIYCVSMCICIYVCKNIIYARARVCARECVCPVCCVLCVVCSEDIEDSEMTDSGRSLSGHQLL